MSKAPRVKGEAVYWTPFADNLRKIIKASGLSGLAWCVDKQIKAQQPTVNRYLSGKQDPSLQMVETLAGLAGYQPWQLLHPDFSVGTMPKLMDAETMRVAAIYGSITDPEQKRIAMSVMEQFAPEGRDESEPSFEPLSHT